MHSVASGETDTQIAACVQLVTDVLGPDLVGMYLFGSSIVGSVQRYSDLDFLVVSTRPTTLDDKVRLASGLLALSRNYEAMVAEIAQVGHDPAVARRPLEVTIVVRAEITPWHYPPTFDFLYGDWLRPAFTQGNWTPWSTQVMPDLALLITMLLQASKTLVGPAPAQLLDPVPFQDVISASVHELDRWRVTLPSDTRNVLLTLARIWSMLATDTMRAKPAAADWALGRLPPEFQGVMQRARAICVGDAPEHWADLGALVPSCTDFMIGHIREQLSVLESSHHAQRSIKLLA